MEASPGGDTGDGHMGKSEGHGLGSHEPEGYMHSVIHNRCSFCHRVDTLRGSAKSSMQRRRPQLAPVVFCLTALHHVTSRAVPSSPYSQHLSQPLQSVSPMRRHPKLQLTHAAQRGMTPRGSTRFGEGKRLWQPLLGCFAVHSTR